MFKVKLWIYSRFLKDALHESTYRKTFNYLCLMIYLLNLNYMYNVFWFSEGSLCGTNLHYNAEYKHQD